MSKYEFKLARLARVRKVQEEIARAQWQNAESKARAARDREEAMQVSISTAIAELGQAQACARLDPTHILQARSAIEIMEKRLSGLHELTEKAQEAAQQLLAPWQVVRTELEGLKRLDEKAKVAFRVNREREEILSNDEVAMERAHRTPQHKNIESR